MSAGVVHGSVEKPGIHTPPGDQKEGAKKARSGDRRCLKRREKKDGG